MLYNQFYAHTKNLLNVGWLPGDLLNNQGNGEFKIQRTGVVFNDLQIDGFKETIDFFEFLLTHGDITPANLMKNFQVEINFGGSYCQYILSTTQELYKTFEQTQNYDLNEIYNIHFCIGDLTEQSYYDVNLKQIFIFGPQLSTVRIVKSLILLSKLPFENDEQRRAFNTIVKRYQNLANNPTELKQVPLENPGGCYIATMVYGDIKHPQVVYLRNYRDNKMLNNVFGRLFVKFYYLIAPFLVSTLKDCAKINHFIKIILDKIIEKFILK